MLVQLIVAPARERGLKLDTFRCYMCQNKVAPARERGLKYVYTPFPGHSFAVAPARERGLKSKLNPEFIVDNPSLPRGSVD